MIYGQNTSKESKPIQTDADGRLLTVAKDASGNDVAGAKITDATMPSGGSGLLGWLSAIWYRLTQPLYVGAIANPSSSFAVPNSSATYAVGDLIANSATAGSVTPMEKTIVRTAAGAAVIVKGRFYKTGTGIVGASFREHFFTSSPTVTNGDDGAFLPNQCLTRIGSIDYNLADMVVHSDGVSCVGIPTTGYPITVDLPSGSVVYSLIEARGAYVRTAAETITTVAETEQE